MIAFGRRLHARALRAVALTLSVAACSSNQPAVPATASAPSPTLTIVSSPPSSVPAGSHAASPAATPGFAFDPESVVGYFESVGYACAPRQPSTTATGHEFQSCQLVDADGRTRSIGVVTDPADNVVDAFLSVRGADGEAILDPSSVLEPFAAFLGALLGVEHGAAQLSWLAAHLGDADSRTTVGELTIATYTPTPEDHSKLTVEVATRAYLDAPIPSGTTP